MSRRFGLGKLDRNTKRRASLCIFVLLMAAAISFLPHSRSSAAQTPAPTQTPIPPLTIYPKVGNAKPSRVVPHGPALALMGGGGEVPEAFRFLHDAVAGSATTHAVDLIVLRASGDNDYDADLMRFSPFNSVQTIVIGPTATADQLARAGRIIDKAQAVFVAGGDQANYARWKGTPVIAAVQHVYDRGGAVGGTSAGLAVLGEYAFDSVAADEAGDAEVTTKNAIADPAEPVISFTHELFRFPPLHGVITDTHFAARDRLGRLTVFLARIHAMSGRKLLGLGINERTALLVDKSGLGRLVMQGKGGLALFVREFRSEPIVSGQPFVAHGISLELLDKAGQRYDFNAGCGEGLKYLLDVDGNRSPIYTPADPYHAPPNATRSVCR